MIGLTGSFLCTKIFGTIMSKQKNGGNIINISSDLGLIAPDQRLYNHTSFKKPVSYSVVKNGVIGLTKYTASYWAKKNIRCNALAPGGIFNNQDKKFVSKIKKLIPLNRMAKINEYNQTILFLASDASSYMTGSIVVSDGGRTII
jgi:NAD(P)-dependent dehydrogenase (short-subunit alcohol dehydrogenase family)